MGSDKLSLNFTGFPPAEIASVNSLKEANDYFKRLFTQPEFSSSESVIVVESLPARSSIQIAFSSSESTLYIDSSAQGVADMAINLEGVTSLNLSDFHSIGNWTLESDRSPALLV